MMRVILPTHLWRLAKVSREIEIQVKAPANIGAVLDVLETTYPMLRGTLRDQVSGERRPFIRFFACGEDWTLEPMDASLPTEVAEGSQPLRIVGAMAGG
jgi:molybdopterin synthase sulfur carrier subunit